MVRITAFEEGDERQDLKPVAERLVFRKPGEVLNLTWGVTPQAAAAAPVALGVPANSPLSCAIAATDERGIRGGNPVRRRRREFRRRARQRTGYCRRTSSWAAR